MNWLRMQALQKPNKKFINELTYKEIDAQVTDLAGRLYHYVKDQRRVALFSHNSEEMALFFLALQAMQVEVLMLNDHLVPEEIEKKLKSLSIRVVFSQDDSFISFNEVLQSDNRENVQFAGDFNLEQIAVIMDTSATSGEFKSVPLRWKQFYAHVQASQKSLGMTEEDNWLLVLPMYHISGLTILLRSLYNGTSVTLMEKFDEKRILQLIEAGTVNMLSIVPTMLNRIVERINEHHLRVVLVGGEFIPKPLVETCLTKKLPIYKTYGMTETTSQTTTFCVLDAPLKLDSVGLPLPGVTIRIAHPDEAGVGEILIQSPMLMDGYLGQAPVAGFFNTQDIGYVDKDGYLYVLDRRKNIIISGGENIYPQEIENVLYAHPAISECAVVGMKDGKWGQVPVLFVVSLLDERSIINYLAKRIAKYKLPKRVIHLAELPKSATNKILKKNLVEQYVD
ncbi:2-succinylbenzoate--CoA ligase [Sporotomaculum syntrophicum]|uniref:2-succinylbenzoate--CoA ligase n=1 Tax=Sporotomaculum syntrophicum TaxID=182264 RepID=A0A9D2WPH0_9FIRM|nr:o-succinylbenzoate--CoA ligase [Sporotomaculum syntrophicum]KAF1084232.1 2-succinylbenzoate--CoA ligase [Sporotomaculum syntrophicum]